MTTLRSGGALTLAGGSSSAPLDLSEAAHTDSLVGPSASLTTVRLEPRGRAAASPSVDRNLVSGTRLPAGVPSSLTAMWECRRAWARTQMQLELEVWPA